MTRIVEGTQPHTEMLEYRHPFAGVEIGLIDQCAVRRREHKLTVGPLHPLVAGQHLEQVGVDDDVTLALICLGSSITTEDPAPSNADPTERQIDVGPAQRHRFRRPRAAPKLMRDEGVVVRPLGAKAFEDLFPFVLRVRVDLTDVGSLVQTPHKAPILQLAQGGR
ncbi:MAG: hypothetical protein U0587_10800 [Candidatus Binatia bacterium]